jgi:hypothetical protein
MEEWFREQPFFNEDRLAKIKWWCSEGYKNYIEYKPPYRIVRKRVYNDDGSYKMKFEFWTVDEKRDLVECLGESFNQKELKEKYIT